MVDLGLGGVGGVSPSPLGTNLGFELGCTGFGLGLGGIGTKGLGAGLDNYQLTAQKKLCGGGWWWWWWINPLQTLSQGLVLTLRSLLALSLTTKDCIKYDFLNK